MFRKGGHLSRHERWTYEDAELEVVNSYKYLGIALTTKLSTTQAVADFIPKAKRKIITIVKALRKINFTDWEMFSKIFDAQMQPRFCTPLRYGVQEEWKQLKRFTYLPSRSS